MIDFKRFCENYNVDIARSGKHHRPGWVNIVCPFCTGHLGYHGGFNIAEGYYNCHRCGFHPLTKVITVLTGVPQNAAQNIIKKYFTVSGAISPQDNRKNIPSQITFPSDTGPLTFRAKQYLISRNFNPDKIISVFKILSTGHTGMYKHRILIPIYFKNQLVSYQCRDIADKSSMRYLACSQNEEIIPHKHCLYNFGQAIARGKQAIVVEGITDVWRLGPRAVATFGIAFTKQQAKLIAINFDRVFIMFDSEPQAQEKAEELGFLIGSAFNNPVEVINLPFLIDEIDPGSLPQNIADDIMKEIGL